MLMHRLSTIANVEELGKNENYVYDINIPGNGMFFGNGILCHNTDSIFLYVADVLKALYGDKYDEVSDEEKTDMSLNIIRYISDYINNHSIKTILQCHNTPSEDTEIGRKFDYQFKEEFIIRKALYLEAKKKYATWIISKEGNLVDKLEIVGMESVRSSEPPFTRSMIKTIVENILKNNYQQVEIIRFINKSIKEYKRLLKEGSYEAGVPGSWGLREYDKPTKPIRAMMTYNNLIKNEFKAGDKGYVFDIKRINLSSVKDKESFRKHLDKIKQTGYDLNGEINVVAIPAGEKLDTKIFEIDYDKMLDRSVYKRIEFIENLYDVNVRATSFKVWGS